jgi:hypothetical protein
MVSVCVALLIVTALGIVGLASFWVQQRTRQIGVRRALGATKGQILRYFQTENFLLATLGIVVGMILAFGINQLMMERYELPRLPLLYLPIGAVVLWMLGQILGVRPRPAVRRRCPGGRPRVRSDPAAFPLTAGDDPGGCAAAKRVQPLFFRYAWRPYAHHPGHRRQPRGRHRAGNAVLAARPRHAGGAHARRTGLRCSRANPSISWCRT